MVQTPNKPATKLPPSKHQFAEVIHRLEAGGAMIPDTPENLMQIIAIWKAYAVPMDFLLAGFALHRRTGIFTPASFL
jgi:hypothetical protein